jgi:SAM-dependent methyltransferase
VSNEREIAKLYQELLHRKPDAAGLSHFLGMLDAGIDLNSIRQHIVGSEEYTSLLNAPVYAEGEHPLVALHLARVELVRQLPKAKKILDLGGGAVGDRRGALVVMGYPYIFDEINIIEPPPDARHEIYQDIPDLVDPIVTINGMVKYHYGSMVDLSRFPDSSFDMVFSGETIEHVSVSECRQTLKEIRRVLTNDGYFCFDTPNRAITEIQIPNGYINPEHKVEYFHSEMLSLLSEASLRVCEMKGVTYMPETAKTRKYVGQEMLTNRGVYDDLESCYLLYYKCKKIE